MTKKKTTKHALILSALSLLMCLSMLVGSTFAWFTDSATSGSNVIQAGTLDIVMEYWDGDSWENAEGKVLEFIKGGNYHGYVGEVRWEPGCTYKLPKIRVRNEGDLAAYVVFRINGITGDEKLLEAITFETKVENIPATLKTGSYASTYSAMEGKSFGWMFGTPDGTVMMDWSLMGKGHTSLNTGHTDTSAEFTISGHMKEEAGNEYQGLRIEGVSITALATQEVYEYDSFGREYDKNAELPVVEYIASKDLATKLTPVNGVITLENDYIVTGEWTSIATKGKDIVIDGKGHTISGLNKPLVAGTAGGNITIKNLTIANSNIGPAVVENGLGTGAFICYKDAFGSAKFENCHLVNSSVTGNKRAAGLIGYISGGELIVKDCSVVNCNITADGGAAAFTALTQVNATITDSKVESTQITATEDREGTSTPLAGAIIGTANGNAVVTITNVTTTSTSVSNNNATAVYSELVGRVVGSATVTVN